LPTPNPDEDADLLLVHPAEIRFIASCIEYFDDAAGDQLAKLDRLDDREEALIDLINHLSQSRASIVLWEGVRRRYLGVDVTKTEGIVFFPTPKGVDAGFPTITAYLRARQALILEAMDDMIATEGEAALLDWGLGIDSSEDDDDGRWTR
jgi:hypothetical protein